MKHKEIFEKVINKQQKELETDDITQGATEVETKGLVDGFVFKEDKYEAGENIGKNEEEFAQKLRDEESITSKKQSYSETEDIDKLEKIKLDSRETIKENTVSKYKLIKPILEKLNIGSGEQIEEVMGLNDVQYEAEIQSLDTKHSNDKRGDLEIAAILTLPDITDNVTSMSDEELAKRIEAQDPSIITLIAKVRREEFLGPEDVQKMYNINMGDDSEMSAIAENINTEDMEIADMFMGSFENDMHVAAMVAGVPTTSSDEEILEILKEKGLETIIDYIKSARSDSNVA